MSLSISLARTQCRSYDRHKKKKKQRGELKDIISSKHVVRDMNQKGAGRKKKGDIDSHI